MSDLNDYREESKKKYGLDTAYPFTEGNLRTGAILRIADAAEAMASNYTRMQRDLERVKKDYDDLLDKKKKLMRSNAALKAWITRLKNNKNPRKSVFIRGS